MMKYLTPLLPPGGCFHSHRRSKSLNSASEIISPPPLLPPPLPRQCSQPSSTPDPLARTLLDLAFGAAFFTARLTGFLGAGRAAFLRAGLAAFFLTAFFVLTAATGASFCLAGLGSSRHPCASRTAIIAPRMPFPISCFIMTALGNMQPSQQIWRIVLVRSPSSPCSQ